MTTTLFAVSDANFDQEVLNSNMPILVDYWASWCRPCQMIAPLLEEVAKEYQGKLKIVKLNVEENQVIPSKYMVQGIPTLMLFKNGKVTATKAGYMTKTQLQSFLDSNLENTA